jgi:hypothetical protein
MATEYILHIASDLKADEILKLWFHGIGIQVEIQFHHKVSEVVVPGFVASCRDQIPERSKIIRNEEFGFTPTASIVFRLVGDRDDPELKGNLIPDIIRQGMVKWLEYTTGDVAFLFNYDNGIFLRKSGELIIDQGWWLDEHLEMLTMPYTLQPFY